MIKFAKDSRNFNLHCSHFIETTDGDRYCKSERIEMAISVIDGHPEIMECKGCYAYGVNSRIEGAVKKAKKKMNVKKTVKRKGRTEKGIEKALKGLAVMDDKKKSRVQTLGGKK